MPTKPAIANTSVVVMANSQSVPALPLARWAGLLLQNDVDITASCQANGHVVARTIACECDVAHTHSSVKRREPLADRSIALRTGVLQPALLICLGNPRIGLPTYRGSLTLPPQQKTPSQQ
jgi:hypothetical protein